MKEFKNRVAVVTGAASGIGRALAARFADAGMKVVLADVEEGALGDAEQALRGRGAAVLAVRTDVSRAADVEALARKTVAAFGGVHVLCNNAGVVAAGPSWDLPLADWEWVLGVNLWGVIHGVRTFLPIMLAQEAGGHIVNTASVAGLVSTAFNGVYNVSKFGVVALSECLYHELVLTGARVNVSVLCPGWVNTRILDAERNRPAGAPPRARTPIDEAMEPAIRQLLTSGLAPEQVAERVFEAVREERLYILTHPDMNDMIRTRMEDVLAERNPTPAALG